MDTDRDGYLKKDEFHKIVLSIAERGIWESAYRQFLEHAQVEIPEESTKGFWEHLNKGLVNPGLVPMKKFVDELELMLMTSGVWTGLLKTICDVIGVKVNIV